MHEAANGGGGTGGEEQQKDGSGGQQEAGAGQQQDQQQHLEGVQQQEQQEALTPELELAGRLLTVLRARKPPPAPGAPAPPHSADDVLAWLDAQAGGEGAAAELGGSGAAGVLRAAARALLAAGAKTPTHLNVMVERYGALLASLLQRAVGEVGGEAAAAEQLLDAAVAGYGSCPSRLLLALDRLQTAGVVAGVHIVSWALLHWPWLQLGPARDSARAAAALSLLRGALANALAAEGAAHEAATRQGAAVREAEEAAAAASEELSRVMERDAAAGNAASGTTSARVAFAQRAQAAAAARLEVARVELTRLEGKVADAGPAAQCVLLALFGGLAQRLGAGDDAMAEAPKGGGGEQVEPHGDGGGGSGWANIGDALVRRREQLAQARALVRPLAVASLPVAAEVASMYREGAIADDLRQVVLGQLGLLH